MKEVVNRAVVARAGACPLPDLRIGGEQTAEGANAALEIESTDETKTLLRFRHAVRPDMVDGVVLD